MIIRVSFPFWLARLFGQARPGKRVTVDGETRRIAAISGRRITLDRALSDGTLHVEAE